MIHASLTLRFRRWSRDWQQGSAWCAQRVDGGALRECGTHYLAAVREVFGAGAVALAESRVDGELELRNGLIVRVVVNVEDEEDNDGTSRSTVAVVRLCETPSTEKTAGVGKR